MISDDIKEIIVTYLDAHEKIKIYQNIFTEDYLLKKCNNKNMNIKVGLSYQLILSEYNNNQTGIYIYNLLKKVTGWKISYHHNTIVIYAPYSKIQYKSGYYNYIKSDIHNIDLLKSISSDINIDIKYDKISLSCYFDNTKVLDIYNTILFLHQLSNNYYQHACCDSS